jgi:chromosome partitioning protein
MILTVGNTKGGTGKTTLAVQLAISLARTGRDVLLVDGDQQGSAQTAISVRTDASRLPALACAQYAEGRVLRDQVRHQAGKYQDVLIDAAGRDSGALRAALVLSDVLLVPFLPRSVDVWTPMLLSHVAVRLMRMSGGAEPLTAISPAAEDIADAARVPGRLFLTR